MVEYGYYRVLETTGILSSWGVEESRSRTVLYSPVRYTLYSLYSLTTAAGVRRETWLVVVPGDFMQVHTGTLADKERIIESPAGRSGVLTISSGSYFRDQYGVQQP